LSVKPSIKYLNKNIRIPHFTTDEPLFLLLSFMLKTSTSLFSLFSSLLNSFPSPPRSGISSSLFFYRFFLINKLYEFIFFSLLSFTRNYIKVKKNFVFFFIIFLIFFILIIVWILLYDFFYTRKIFSWFIYRILK